MSGIDLDILGMGAAKPMPRASTRQDTEAASQNLRLAAMQPPATLTPVTVVEVSDQNLNAAAQAVAVQVGYVGTMSVGALEDEIRFYQRRTVEAILETGKRLLVLKELTPHGEFTKRVELLGFSGPTARRFMQAAAKTSKSLNLSVLSTQVKSASAFLELVTHDDDVLEDLSHLDDIDRMSASQLRAHVRQSEQSINRLQSDLNTAQSRLVAEAKTLPPPLLTREVDAHLQKSLNAEAMGAAALDLISRQVGEMASGGDYLEERAMTLHSCLTALLSRVSLALGELESCAGDHELTLPERPQMVVSESMARDYLAAHTGYIEMAIELAQKAMTSRSDVIGRGPGRPSGSKNKSKGDSA